MKGRTGIKELIIRDGHRRQGIPYSLFEPPPVRLPWLPFSLFCIVNSLRPCSYHILFDSFLYRWPLDGCTATTLLKARLTPSKKSPTSQLFAFKMRSSVLLAVSGALMAVAAPVLEERKVIWKTAVAIKWVTHTVTAKAKSTTTTAESTTSSEVVTTTSAEPTTSTAPAETTPPPAPVIPEAPAAPVIPEAPPLREFIPEPVIQAPAQQAPAQQAPAPVQQAPASGDYASTMLYHHNVHRSNHSSPDLAWSDTLAGYAAQAASKCVFAHDL